LEVSEKFTAGNYSQSHTCKTCDLTLNGTNNHSECSGDVYYKEMESKNTKNNHPTVKPTALMSYLIKMITPKCGIVLDPFAGSGSTLIAAKQNNFKYIGIEKELEYFKIAEARLK
jgi:DNA modification methylase